ncbi:transposase [Aquibacillus albus]|uniref:Transposase n=1 Tax=Aquibacillus albus TaxID=1168171 RepID=A0ABS2MVI7_9BACI|nr:transposase [Aquibacillus albus]
MRSARADISGIENNGINIHGLTFFYHCSSIVGMTTNRLLRLFDQHNVQTRKVLPRAITINEFKGDAGEERFQTNVVDVENKVIIDILPDRKIETIEKYLRSCDTSKGEMVVMDLSKSFKLAVRRVLGDPLIIADRFHFMRQVYWALDEVRREVQRNVDKETRIHL